MWCAAAGRASRARPANRALAPKMLTIAPPLLAQVVMYDSATQRPRGFGFVTYVEEAALDRVFEARARGAAEQ